MKWPHPWQRLHRWAHLRVEMTEYRTDPHKPVVIAHVPADAAPALLDALHEYGFSAHASEPDPEATGDVTISVPRGEADAAQALADGLSRT